MLDPDQVGAVREMIHHGLDRVPRVRRRQRGVRCGLEADHPAAARAQATSTSSGFIRGVGHTARAPACVMNTGWLDASKVSRQVRSLEWDTSIARPSSSIWPTARPPNTGGQLAVARLLQAAAERVGLRVGDADLPHEVEVAALLVEACRPARRGR